MPHPTHEPSSAIDPVIRRQPIELRWTASLVAPREEKSDLPLIQQRALVMMLHIVDEHHTLLEAWLETPTGHRSVIPQQPVASRVSAREGFLHVDADLGGRRVVAMSMRLEGDGAPCPPARRPIVYAQTPLLTEAGFAPGTCNPPTARRHRPEADAVPA